jgi:PEP-CTERM motif
MRHRSLAVIVALVVSLPAYAYASTITEYTETPSTNTAFWGQSVTTSAGGPWDHIEFSWLNTGGPFAVGSVYLFTTAYTGTPSGLSASSYLATATDAGNSYVFASSLVLSALTQYFFYTDVSFEAFGNATGTYAGGDLYVAGGSTFTFGNFTGQDVAFRLTGTDLSTAAPVPEPASLTLVGLGLGLAGLGARRWRQRK